MTRRRWHLVAAWWLIAATLAALLANYIADRDTFRAFWAAIVVVCWLALRRTFTEEPTE